MNWLLLLVLASAPDTVTEAELEAEQALRAGRVAEALDLYEAAIRLADDTPTKARLRDLYRKAGWAEPRPSNQGEEVAIAIHIRNERMRVMGSAAQRFENGGKLHAAIILRRALIEMAGGEETDRGKEEMNRIRGMVRRLTEDPSDEQKELVAKLMRAKRTGDSILKAARKLLAQREYRVVVRVCQEIMFGAFDQETQNAAVALRKEAEEAAASDVSAAEKEAAREVLADPRFLRLEVRRSRQFIYIGPKTFIDSIPTDQMTELDLAYIYQSDLTNTQLTLDGVRIVLYYQETFDFGGGLAGGKLIRIGNRAIRLPIAGMLHYHELGHCIFGRGWLHHGFTEGLADFAAGFTLDALGQTAAAQDFITNARDQFVRYFCGRAVRYFDIQPYRPSAGFLFYFLPAGEAPFDWEPYREAFHLMRAAQFGSWPEREHQLMRFFGYVMSTQYGKDVFDTLADWGWPVRRSDWSRVPPEAQRLLSDVKQAEMMIQRGLAPAAEVSLRGMLASAPDGWIASRMRYALLRARMAQGQLDGIDEEKRLLGIVDAFQVLGPFHSRRQTAYVVYPCEVRIDQSGEKRVRYGIESAQWKPANVRPDGYVDLRQQGFGYPEHACAFGLAYVQVDRPTPARVWLGSDDGHTLYVNGELAEKRATGRTFRFDDDFADVDLRPGWNRLLVKVHNGAGQWGFLMRVTLRNGDPIPAARFSAADLENEVERFVAPKLKPFPLVADEFRGLSGSRWIATVGKFDTQNGLLRPQGTAKLGLWQRFVVDPDKPKDGPANIMWLKNDDLARADSLELELVAKAGNGNRPPAKFGFTIDGENENDAQSGHTFVFSDASDRKDTMIRCDWYRYDQLLFLQLGAQVKPAETYTVKLRRIGSKWWVTVNDVPVFDEVDAPRLPAFGFGLMTWGKGPEFESLKLNRLEPTR